MFKRTIKFNGRKFNRLIALGLAVMTLASTCVQVSFAASSYYRDTLGTNKALGSPLSNSDFSTEDWDKWEMAIFGMFLGNYVKLGEEDYSEAFKSGSDGLKALQFAAGGDVNSNGTLRKMLNVAMTAQKANYKQLYARYKYVELGDVSRLDLGKRGAKFLDLVPKPVNIDVALMTKDAQGSTENKDEIIINTSDKMVQPMVFMQMNKDQRIMYGATNGGSQEGIGDYNKFTGTVLGYAAELPEISVTVSGQEKVLFSLMDGYDAQLMQMVLAKIDDKTLEELIDANPDIVMDAFGNICALYNSRPIVIVPASANKNLNKEKEVNLLNSLIVNGVMVGSSQTNMEAAAASGYISDSDSWFNDNYLSIGGTVAVAASSEKVKAGKTIMYNDTDPLLIKDIYQYIKNTNGILSSTLSDFENSGKFPLLNEGTTTGTTSGTTNDPNATGTTDPNAAGTTDPNATGTTSGTTNDPNNTVTVTPTTDPNGANIAVDPTEDAVERGKLMLIEPYSVDYTNLSFGKYINTVIDANSLHNAPLKFEVAGTNTNAIDFKYFLSTQTTTSVTDQKGAAQLALANAGNMFPYTLIDNTLDSMLLVTGGSDTNKTNLFNSHYYITPSMTAYEKYRIIGMDTHTFRFYKDMIAFGLRNLDGSVTGNVSDPSVMRTQLSKLKSPSAIFTLISSNSSSEASRLTGDIDDDGSTSGGTYIGTLGKEFATTRFELDQANKDKLLKDDLKIKDVAGILEKPISSLNGLYGKTTLSGSEIALATVTRICKVYKPSAVFEAVSKIYDLDNSALFKEYTTNMYISYLDWYGILDNKSEADIRLDTAFFNGNDYLNIDIDDLVDAMTDEEKQRIITNNTYKLLDTSDAGREYRQHIISDLIMDLFTGWYNLMSASNDSDLGFLNVSGYKDNPLTSAVIENWELISSILFGIMFIVIIAVGIINKRGIAWFITVEAVSLLSIAAVPAYAEITPYICNNVIQKAFHENAMFWLASEEVNNMSQYQEMSNQSITDSTLTDQEVKEAVVLLNSIRLQQSDKTLLVKLDTSKKVIDQISIGWDKLQQKASTRWLVPNLIQQMSAENDNYNYVYITTYDWLNNMTRGYLASLEKETNSDGSARTVKGSMTYETAYSILSSSFASGEFNGLRDADSIISYNIGSADEKKNFFQLYKQTNDVGLTADDSYRSITRTDTDTIDDVHTRIYMIPSEGLKFTSGLETAGDGSPGMQTADWDALSNNPSVGITSEFKDNFIRYNDSLLNYLNTYNRYDESNGAVDIRLSNLWMTEGPGLYFYTVVKDTLPITEHSVQSISTNLLGGYKTVTDEEGNAVEDPVRTSFMHMGDTGYTRDFLDLEELFTNALPYLYAEQIVAGGNGKEGADNTGLLGDADIGDKYSIYKDNKQSWLYRSNWVTKIMSDPVYSKSATIYSRDASGARVAGTAQTMVDPRSYSGRDMVFSRAQMHSMGLQERDLNLLELKLVRLNDEVADEWTKIINYSNIKNMTPEIMERLMTVTAVTSFNKIVTRTNLLNETMSLYPRDLDLRNISWDSLLRNMLVSSTNNSTYLSTSNIMKSILEACGFWVGLFTCIVTFLNMIAIPFIRNVILVLMLLLVIVSIVFNLFKGAKEKIKASTGWLLSYLAFTALTAVYYYYVALMIGRGNSAEVLSNGVTVALTSTGVTFKMFLMTLLDFAYIICLVKYFKDVVFKGGLSGLLSYMKDGGFSFFYDVASNVSNGIGRGLAGVRGAIRSQNTTAAAAANNKSQAVENKKENGKEKPIDVKGSVDAKTSDKGFEDKTGLSSTMDDASWAMNDLDKSSKAQVEKSKKEIVEKINEGKTELQSEQKNSK